MKGDFSRDTYRPASHYSRVLMQQGRVQLDADWNEQAAILLGYMRALTRDVFGQAAGPADECGFRIVTQSVLAGMGQDEAAAVKAFLKAEKVDLGDRDFVIMPGRYYVGGLPVEANGMARFQGQVGYPLTPEEKNVDLAGTSWLAYLDVWEEFVSPDEDAAMRDVALGGVDTCARAQVRWRVRLLPGSEQASDLDALTGLGTGRLRARANPTEADDVLCSIAPDARYQGPENQLYRVEIQTAGAAVPGGAAATFKWSRDNGSTVFPIAFGTGRTMTLAHLGRDAMTTLTEGDWVELDDPVLTASTGVGRLAQVTKVDRDDLRVDLTLPAGAQPLPGYTTDQAAALRPLLRRWDHKGVLDRTDGALPVVEGAANEIVLEDGVRITFEEGGTYRAGDYWLIPARVATGDVVWPGVPDAPQFLPAAGPNHVYAPLAAYTARAAAGLTDLRCRISRLPCAAT